MAESSEVSDNSDNDLTSSVLDTETIIIEVEKRPALYNKHLKEYSDRNLKEKLWGEVYSKVISTWNKLSAEEKHKRGT